MPGYFSDQRDKSKLIPYEGKATNGTKISGINKFSQIEKVTSFRSGRRSHSTQTNEEILNSARDAAKGSYDTGHTFFSSKEKVSLSHPDVYLKGSGDSFYKGALALSVKTPVFTPVPPIEDVLYGQKAIGATYPTKSAVSFANVLGELREGLPTWFGSHLLKRRGDIVREAGSEYLNVQFGWLPLVSDVQKIARMVLDSRKILEQYERDSGRVVRRRFDFPETTTTEVTRSESLNALYWINSGTAWGSLYQGGVVGRGTITETRTVTQRYWFSGAYSYYLANPFEVNGKMERFEQLANKLLGLRLTPEVLWELSPWSWFADWYATIGLATNNAVAFSNDGLVLRYGYLMRETTTRHLGLQEGIRFKSLPPMNIVNLYTQVQKERVKASPYGFALKPDAFNARQWAILGALGMTKAPRVLR